MSLSFFITFRQKLFESQNFLLISRSSFYRGVTTWIVYVDLKKSCFFVKFMMCDICHNANFAMAGCFGVRGRTASHNTKDTHAYSIPAWVFLAVVIVYISKNMVSSRPPRSVNQVYTTGVMQVNLSNSLLHNFICFCQCYILTIMTSWSQLFGFY